MPLESVLAERAVSDPQAFGLMVPTAMDLQPKPVQQWPVQGKTNQPAQPGATFLPKPSGIARNAQDAIFEGWTDEVIDALK